MGFWEKLVLTVFPKVDGPSGRGLMAPPGLTALGAKGSVRDRLRLPDGFSGLRPRELYSTAPLGKYGALRRHFVCRLTAAKTFTTGLRPGTTSQPPLRASEKSFPLARFAGLPPQAVAE